MKAALRKGAGKLFSRARGVLRTLHVPAPRRPVVVLQSDDWGRTGMPDPGAIVALRAEGYPVGGSPWDHYGLETREDLESLGTLLLDRRDADGRHAAMTAVFVMANANLEVMRANGYSAFSALTLCQGLPAPWRDRPLISAYRDMAASKAFHPALHGYTHFNPRLMLELAREDSERGRRVRALHGQGIPYLASLTPEFNFALLDRSGVKERFIDAGGQAEWIDAGVRAFRDVFGHPPASACAPGYRFNAATCAAWRRAGIRIAHASGGIAGFCEGVWILPRNVHFEPALEPDALGSALAESEAAVRRGEPIVVCTHSINYISRHLGRAAEGRAVLAALLDGLRERHPDLRFASEAELFESWQRRDGAWWRRPTRSELLVRLQT